MGRVYQSHYFDNYSRSVNSQTIFFRAKLHIEFDQEHDPNTFAPAHNYTKYLTVRVYNYGKSTAHNCKGIVRVIPNKVHPSENFPSDRYKKLVWGSEPDLNDLKDIVDIQKDNWDILHVVFAHSNFSQILTEENTPRRYASFSKKERLANNGLSIDDSFTIGTFLIEITINSDETKTRRRFELHVDSNYINLGMKMLPLSKKDNVKYQLSRIF